MKLLPKLPKVTMRTYRRRLAFIEAVPQFAILGIASGLVTGCVIIAFRLLIEWPLGFFIADAESFEQLNQLTALLLPIGGSLALLGMLAFLPATDRQVGVPHVLQRLARHQGPLALTLNRASVASIMIRNFARVKMQLTLAEARLLLEYQWRLVEDDGMPKFVMPTEDLAVQLESNELKSTALSSRALSAAGQSSADLSTEGNAADESDPVAGPSIDLGQIPAHRKDVTGIMLQATLAEALTMLDQSGKQALFVNRISAPMMDSPVGIVMREDIESWYGS